MPKLPTANTRIVRRDSYGTFSVQFRQMDDGTVKPVTSGTVQLYTCKADGSDLRAEPPMDLVQYMTAEERAQALTLFGNVLNRIFAENSAYTVVDKAG